MKTLGVLFLVGVVCLTTAVPVPINSILKYEARAFPSEEEFGTYLKVVQDFLKLYKGVLIPKEIYDLLQSLTIDDYEAMKYLNMIGREAKRDMSSAMFMSRMYKSFHPEFYKRLETAGISLLRRLQQLSYSTKGRIINTILLVNHFRRNKREAGEVMLKAYLAWPQENKKELDEIFPQMSTELAEIFEITEADSAFVYPSDLPDCSVEDEPPYLCTIFMSIFNQQLAEQ